MHVTRHHTTVSAPAKVVYDLIADATRWPYTFGPTIHVKQTPIDATEERLRLWALANGQVRTWESKRLLDPASLRVKFQQVVTAAPVAFMSGEWIVQPAGDDVSTVELRHDFEAVDDDPVATELILAAVERNSLSELASLKRTAELHDRLPELVITFADTLQIEAPVEHVYDFLYHAERWPQVLPHVSRLDLTEPEPGLQVMVMDTLSPAGDTHTTESVRVCFTNDTIVYKQTATPAVMSAHVGRWELRRTESGGTEATSHHTVVIKPEAVGEVLGPDGTVAQARELIRTALGRNSLTTLTCAKQALEQP